MKFHLQNGTDVNYSVSKYDFTSDNITVTWSDNQGNTMLTEFTDFNEADNAMVQKRGREVRSSKWNNYNRRFNRCN